MKTLGFFYVPFAVALRLLVEVRWTRRLLLQVLAVTVGLALLFAAVGFVEWATGRLLISNEKVLAANDLKPYFRVNSLFFDPNVYGRFLALVMVAAGRRCCCGRRAPRRTRVAVALALLWAALVLTLSESSFAALLVGLAVLAALRWRAVAGAGGVRRRVGARGGAGRGRAGHARPQDRTRSPSLNEASSGRAKLVRGGLRMAADRPLTGFGSGSFADRYRAREHVVSSRLSAESHTIPVTVAAEQGAIGLAAYAFAAAGPRSRLRVRRAAADAAAPPRGRRAGRRAASSRRRSARCCCTPSCTPRSWRTRWPGRCSRSPRRCGAWSPRARRGPRRRGRRAVPRRFRPEPVPTLDRCAAASS